MYSWSRLSYTTKIYLNTCDEGGPEAVRHDIAPLKQILYTDDNFLIDYEFELALLVYRACFFIHSIIFITFLIAWVANTGSLLLVNEWGTLVPKFRNFSNIL